MGMFTCYYSFVHIHSMHNAKNEPKVNYGFREIMRCHYRFYCNKSVVTCITLVSDADNEGSCAWVGQSIYGKSLHLPLKFAMNPKTSLQEKKVLKKCNLYIILLYYSLTFCD